MLEEQLEILAGLFYGPEGWTFSGRFYSIADAHLRPRPGRRIHVIVGGDGTPRSMRIAARFADEYNLTGSSPERAVERFAELDEICRTAGRDPSTLHRSVMATTIVGIDAAEVARRIAALVALIEVGGSDGADGTTGAPAVDAWLEDHRPRWIVGTPDEARATIARYAEAGCERLMLQDLIPWDLDMVDLLGREIVARG